jgi:hypothetical protein
MRRYCVAGKAIVNTCVAVARTLSIRRANKKSASPGHLQGEEPMTHSRQAWYSQWGVSARSVTCERQSRKLRGSSLRHSRAEATYKYGYLTAGAVEGYL